MTCLVLQRQVGQQHPHQWLRQQGSPESLALRGVMQGLRHRLAQQRRAAQHAIQPRSRGHLQQYRGPAPRLAQHGAPGLLELHFGTGVAAIAQLVLQAAQAHGIARPIGHPARHEEATQPFVGTRQHQVRIGVRHRQEPFMAGQQVGLAAPGRADRLGARGHRAQVRTALLLGQAHADQGAALAADGRVAGVELARIQDVEPVAPVVDDAGRLARQQGHRGVGHGGGTQGAGLHLALHQVGGRARHVRARHGLRPGPAVQPARHDAGHQRVPGRVKGDLVLPVAGRVIGQQARRIAIGLGGGLQRLGPAQPCAVLAQLGLEGRGALTPHGLLQHRIGLVQRIIFQRCDLVGHLVRKERLHGASGLGGERIGRTARPAGGSPPPRLLLRMGSPGQPLVYRVRRPAAGPPRPPAGPRPS
ncbi:Uncharacterised protein [Bordetella pertussis]|nr:Uncharacterised protein [Bordetella pertussis]